MVLHEGFAELGPNTLQHISVKVQILVFAEVAATEGALKCVAIHNLEFAPADHARGGLLRLLDGEGAVVEVKGISLLLQQVGENFLSVPRVVLVAVAVAEHVLFAGVPVQIAVEKQLALLLEVDQQLLHVHDGGMQLLVGRLPAAIQVEARDIASSVSVDNSVWVEHGHDFEHEGVSEHAGAQTRPQQVVNHALHHKTAVRFTWMHAR